MSISVHEWPLPSSDIDAKAVVFEMHCPAFCALWREATYVVLHDLFKLKSSLTQRAQISSQLHSYMSGIKVSHPTTPRISLASSTKSFLVAHYRDQKFPVSQSAICVNNGLTWRLYNKEADRWVTPEDLTGHDIVKRCSLTIPDNPLYQGLDFSVSSTTHTTNAAIAAQSSGSRNLSLHEFIAFGSLRAGGGLQWMNIARELGAGDLSLNQDMVYVLFAQAVQQIGALSVKGELLWHQDLAVDEFALTLVDKVHSMHNRVAANWQEATTLKSMTLILLRLLNATLCEAVTRAICELLRTIRETLYGWMVELVATFENSDSKHVEFLKKRIRDVAVTCRTTFDSEAAHREQNFQTPRDVQILLHCGIVMHDNRSSSLLTETASRTTIDRDTRLLVRIEDRVWDGIQRNAEGIDGAIQAVWPVFSRGTSWERLEKPNDRWVCCKTTAEADSRAQDVQMDLLDGRLLIDAKPLAMLPVEVTDHEVYKRLLGKVLDFVLHTHA